MNAIKFVGKMLRSFRIMELLEKATGKELTMKEGELIMSFLMSSELTNEEIVKEIQEIEAA